VACAIIQDVDGGWWVPKQLRVMGIRLWQHTVDIELAVKMVNLEIRGNDRGGGGGGQGRGKTNKIK